MPGYTMSANEVAWWQDQAALLDPDAYELVVGTNLTNTVPAGQHWYVMWAWKTAVTGGGTWRFHRHGRAEEPLIIPENTALVTSGVTNSLFYLCKPASVVANVSDNRYADYQSDPRALYFERIMRLGTLAQYTIGVTITNSTGVDATFPTDFDDALMMHSSTHDLAWLGLEAAGTNAVITGQDEISDADRVRFANSTIMPFKRTTWTKIRGQGATQSEGTGTITYVKLPTDW